MPNISSEIIQDGDFPNISLFKRKLDSCLEDSSQGGSKISTDDPFLSHYSLDCSVNYALSPRADGLNIILESLDIEIPDSSFDSLSNSTVYPFNIDFTSSS